MPRQTEECILLLGQGKDFQELPYQKIVAVNCSYIKICHFSKFGQLRRSTFKFCRTVLLELNICEELKRTTHMR